MKGVKAKTLIIWGRMDGLTPLRQAEALRRSISDSELAVIDGAGHVPMIEKPETMNRLIRDFLTGSKAELPGVARA